MKALFYYLRRYKTATLLHLLGLSMALAAFYLFMTQVEYNNTFNHSLKDYQRTYRVEQCGSDSKWYPSLPAPLKELWGQIPHIEEITLNMCGAVPLNIKVGENLFQTGLSTIDKTTLDFWGIHLLPGSNSWIPEKGNSHPQDYGQHGARGASALCRTLSGSPACSLRDCRPDRLLYQHKVVAEFCRAHPDILVVLPIGLSDGQRRGTSNRCLAKRTCCHRESREQY